MAPQPSKHGRCTRLLVVLCLLLSTAAGALGTVNVVPISSCTNCSSPSSPAPDRHADVGNDDVEDELLGSLNLQPSTGGFFSGRGATDSFFSPVSSVTVVAFTTMLFCVFAVLRILHSKQRNHEEPPAMSMAAMLVVVYLGCVALHFILSNWVFLLVTFVYMFS